MSADLAALKAEARIARVRADPAAQAVMHVLAETGMTAEQLLDHLHRCNTPSTDHP